MKIKSLLTFMAAMLLLTALPARAHTEHPVGWDQLKSLVGTWTAKDGQEITYKLIANDSALVESSNCKGTEMVTIYHQDGKNLMLTHYCAAQNQPRMTATPGSGAPNCCISFKMVDCSNMSSKDATCMNKLVVTFKDQNHIRQTWTLSEKGKTQDIVMDLERKQ